MKHKSKEFRLPHFLITRLKNVESEERLDKYLLLIIISNFNKQYPHLIRGILMAKNLF